MITDFVSVEIDLQENTIDLHKAVESELLKYGKPLRWAITAIDSEKGKVVLEAVVTKQKN
ncbi:hypothetical protein Riv7116_0735 [Rivularia sp. PCC 7116]|uniref:hypothetical protein n=1 Tax=Rivularia sp. PCC 7116 TaxID=373994 RepID=UPI00029F2282|nr:hypothetical protein [Rivularia sp. PCC 7116]AFY53322.1 hypothetical protein Riv7116_0735 [Rivularia sp. PCC 7116]